MPELEGEIKDETKPESNRFRDAIDRRKAAMVASGSSSSGLQRLDLQNEANAAGPIETMGKAVSAVNRVATLYQWADRKLIPSDPNFNYEEAKPFLLDGIPGEYKHKFNSIQSYAEGMELRSDLLNELHDLQVLNHAGFKGFAAMAVAGIVDVDLPLMMLPGGTYLGTKVGKVVGTQGRIANSLRTGAAGLEAGVVTETVGAALAPTGDWTDIPNAALGGMIFGTGLGSLSKGDVTARNANKSIATLREDFEDSVANGETGRIDYMTPVPQRDTVFDTSTVGAAQTPGSGGRIKAPDSADYDPELSQPGVVSMRKQAETFIEDNDIDFDIETAFNDSVLGRAAKKMYTMINKTLLASDSDSLLNSKSPIARALAFKLLENPVGLVRNNKSGAMLNNIYFKQIASPVNTNYGRFFDTWAGSQGRTDPKPLWRANTELRNKFDQEVMTELQYRYHDGGNNPNSSPAVREYADMIDQASAQGLKIMQGENGEAAVRGSETLAPEKGWFRQMWRGDKIIKAIQEAPKGKRKATKKAIENALVSSYKKVYPGLDPELAKQYARAVIRRALAKERGIDTNLARMLEQEGKDFLEETLIDNGFTQDQAARFIDGLKGVNADKGKESMLKHRKDVDLREPIAGTNLRIMDLVDTDILGVWTAYSRRASGAAAMARHGIQKADKQDIINAILADQVASGGGNVTRQTLESVFSYFEGGAYAGGINPWLRRSLQTTNLSLLNSLGLTQLAETGVQIAAVGMEAFMRTAPREVQDMLSGKNAVVMDELKGWMAFIEGEHNIYMDHMMLDEISTDPGVAAELGNWIDGLLVKGRHLQGYTSGFYKVKQLQQRIAVRSMLHRLSQHFEGSKEMGRKRLQDLGLNPKVEQRIARYFDSGIIEKSPDGDVVKLNFDKWNPSDVMDFAAALNRHADQVVQRAQRGESSSWMHKDVGALLMHLKSFTMLAMQKQLLRNARIMDAEAAMGFIYSMATAGTIYTAQQAISGREYNLTPEKIAKGAFQLSNMTGWIPQWSDPLASMLGMDDLRFSHYGAQGVGGDVIGTPPVLPTMNRIAHIPEATLGLLTNNYKNEDIQALQATPIIGNAYGFSYMFNAMKTSGGTSKKKPAKDVFEATKPTKERLDVAADKAIDPTEPPKNVVDAAARMDEDKDYSNKELKDILSTIQK